MFATNGPTVIPATIKLLAAMSKRTASKAFAEQKCNKKIDEPSRHDQGTPHPARDRSGVSRNTDIGPAMETSQASECMGGQKAN